MRTSAALSCWMDPSRRLEAENSVSQRITGHGTRDRLSAGVNPAFPVCEEEYSVLDDASAQGGAELIANQRLTVHTRAVAKPVICRRRGISIEFIQ